MPTNIRPELSKKKPYYVERHRYYELKHFCLQWPVWVRYLRELDIRYPYLNSDGIPRDKNPAASNPTAEEVERREYYSHLADIIRSAAYDADESIGYYILRAVTEGLPYDILKLKYNIPCSKEYYYNRYRKFFWILDKRRK